MVGVTHRMVRHGHHEVESLGVSGIVTFNRVRWPGIDAPVLVAEAQREHIIDEGLARRASLIRGTGLAETLEVFWDDPVPHIVQSLPPGISLRELWPERLGPEMASSLVRAIVEGVSTLHQLGFAAGALEPASIWLTAHGDALLLGNGLNQLQYAPNRRHRMPPEEYFGAQSPQLPGDSFRVGLMLMHLAVGADPFPNAPAVPTRETDWALDFGAHRPVLGTLVSVIETLMQPHSPDRPRGSLLREVIDQVSPHDWRQRVAAQVNDVL